MAAKNWRIPIRRMAKGFNQMVSYARGKLLSFKHLFAGPRRAPPMQRRTARRAGHSPTHERTQRRSHMRRAEFGAKLWKTGMEESKWIVYIHNESYQTN